MTKTGRNEQCPCGSGKKYKHCCLPKSAVASPNSSIESASSGQGNAAPADLRDVASHRTEGHGQSLQTGEDKYDADFYYTFGNNLQAQGKLDAAITSYRKALALRADHAETHNNLGLALQSLGDFDSAIESYRQALSLKPDDGVAMYNLGNALAAKGERDAAVECYRQAVKLDPGNASAAHLIAALTAQSTERPPSQYVEKLFDGYAASFDTHLTQNLGYKMPSELAALLRQYVTPPAGEWDVLDLGCGTGLSGLEFAPHARQLTGVDLSGKMLEKAREKNIYHRLVHSDLLSLMQGEPASSYDVIIAADVLVYLGALDEIVSEARRLLHAGGFFLFSVEALEAVHKEAPDSLLLYQLNPSGRYAHSARYLDTLSSANGFSPIAMASMQVRSEREIPIAAWAAVWKCL